MRYLSVWLCAIVATVATDQAMARGGSASRSSFSASRSYSAPKPSYSAPKPSQPRISSTALGTIRSEQEVARQRQQLARQQRQHRNLFWTAKETFLLPSLRRQFDNVRPADPAGLARPF
jgi:hypothetical protein